MTTPTWRYWTGVLLGLPLAVVVPSTVVLYRDWDSALPLGLLVLVALAGVVAIVNERRIRALPAAWRAGWALLGLVLAGALGAAYAAIAFVVALSIACHGVEQCL